MIHYTEIKTKRFVITFYEDMYQGLDQGVDLFPQVKLGWDNCALIQIDWLWWCVGVYVERKENPVDNRIEEKK